MARATAHEIFSSVQASAKREMDRSSIGLFFSGLSGGLNISFGFMAVAAMQAEAPDPWKTLAATAVYPLGFLLVILPRAQLFTENTLTPVLLALEHPGRKTILGTGRIWGVVLLANLLGAFAVSFVLAKMPIGTRLPADVLRETAMHSIQGSWGSIFLRGVFGAWLVALLVWMLHTGASPVGEAILIWLTTAMIYLAGFNHSIAGAVEGLYLANTHAITYLEWFRDFQLPVTLGNAVGGIVFVALVNYGQAVGAGSDVEVAERQRVVERVHEAVAEKRADAVAHRLVNNHDAGVVEQKLGRGGEVAGEIVDRALSRTDAPNDDGQRGHSGGPDSPDGESDQDSNRE